MTTRKELRAAKRFLSKHGIGSLPGPRSPTGESAGDQRSGYFAGFDRADTGETGGRRLVSYDGFPTLEAWEDWMVSQGHQYQPMVGGAHPTQMEQLEKRARMKHVLSYMLPDHIELLHARHVEGRTLDDIGKEHGVSRQAIIKRLRTAEADFRRYFAEHWLDELDPEVFDLEYSEVEYRQTQRGPGGVL